MNVISSLASNNTTTSSTRWIWRPSTTAMRQASLLMWTRRGKVKWGNRRDRLPTQMMVSPKLDTTRSSRSIVFSWGWWRVGAMAHYGTPQSRQRFRRTPTILPIWTQRSHHCSTPQLRRIDWLMDCSSPIIFNYFDYYVQTLFFTTNRDGKRVAWSLRWLLRRWHQA